jgi:hypothetical protein
MIPSVFALTDIVDNVYPPYGFIETKKNVVCSILYSATVNIQTPGIFYPPPPYPFPQGEEDLMRG